MSGKEKVAMAVIGLAAFALFVYACLQNDQQRLCADAIKAGASLEVLGAVCK